MNFQTRSKDEVPNEALDLVLKPLTLRKNFLWTFVGNVVYSGCQWSMLAVLAKLGSPEMVGQLALGLAFTTPVFMLTNLQLRAIQATDAKDEYYFGDYLGLRLVSTILAMLVIVGIGIVLVLAGTYDWETVLVTLAVGSAKAFEAISDVIYGLMQKHERMDLIAVSMMIKGLLSLAVMASLVWITGSIFAGALGLAATWLALLATYDLGNACRIDQIHPFMQASTLWSLIKLSLPLGTVMMLISLRTDIPRYFVAHYLSEEGLGYFAAMSSIAAAGGMVVSALGQSASPRLAKYYAADEMSAFWRLLLKLVGIGASLGVAGVAVALLFGREILTFLYRPDYANHVDVFTWLMLAGGMWYIASMFGYGATARRNIRWQLIALLLVITVTTVISQLAIPGIGLLGAAYSTVAASASGAVCYAALNFNRRGIRNE